MQTGKLYGETNNEQKKRAGSGSGKPEAVSDILKRYNFAERVKSFKLFSNGDFLDWMHK